MNENDDKIKLYVEKSVRGSFIVSTGFTRYDKFRIYNGLSWEQLKEELKEYELIEID